MAYKERTDEEILNAFELWLKSKANPDEKLIGNYDGQSLSANEMVTVVREKTSLGLDLLQQIRSLSITLDFDPLDVVLISLSDDTKQ